MISDLSGSQWTKFREQKKGLDVITLFHKPTVAASKRVLTLLKQASAEASEPATEDQASDHSHQNAAQRTEFELDIMESPPTPDQLSNILEYVGARRAGDIIQGAKDAADAMKKLKESGENFKAPVVSRFRDIRRKFLNMC